VLPGWRSSRANPQDAMRFDARTTTGSHDHARLRRLLVGVEVGLCVVCLLVGALLLQSFARVLDVHRGFDRNDIATLAIGLPATRYPVPKRAQFLQTALERIQQLPGIQSSG